MNYYNNTLDSVPNTSRFHGLLNLLPWSIQDKVQCGSCGFNAFLTQKVRDIAAQLGILDPQYHAIKTIDKEGAVAGDNYILISQGYAAALENSTSPFTAEEIEGTLAHEIGHIALDHSNSLLADPCFDAVDNGKIKASSEAFQICFAAANRQLEKQADLFTLRNPPYAKQLIQMMKKWLWLSGPSARATSFDNHPRTESRIDYLTQGYCDAVQYNDIDLCTI